MMIQNINIVNPFGQLFRLNKSPKLDIISSKKLNFFYLSQITFMKIGVHRGSTKRNLTLSMSKTRYFFHKNLTSLWSWILRTVPRSAVPHAPLCNTLFFNKNSPKTVKILTAKELIYATTISSIDKHTRGSEVYNTLNLHPFINTTSKIKE